MAYSLAVLDPIEVRAPETAWFSEPPADEVRFLGELIEGAAAEFAAPLSARPREEQREPERGLRPSVAVGERAGASQGVPRNRANDAGTPGEAVWESPGPAPRFD